MKDLTITYAHDAEGNIVFVENACKGKKYFCIECKKALLLRVSKIPKGHKFYRRSHFSHRNDSQCHPETILHNHFKKMAAAMLESKIGKQSSFEIYWECAECGEHHHLNLLDEVSSVKMEYRLDDCQPDIALLSTDCKLKAVVEVVVNHKPEPQVVKYYKDHGIIIVRIDLQSFNDLDHLEERIKKPTEVAHCLTPICDVCGGRKNTAQMRIVDTLCWKCHSPMKMAMIVDTEKTIILGPNDFSTAELHIAQQHGASIEHKYSQTVKDSYFANVCKTCDAFIGEFYLHEYFEEETYIIIDLGYKCFHCGDLERRHMFDRDHEGFSKAEENRAEQEQSALKRDEIRPCPDCGGILKARRGPYGMFYGCCNYPECRYTESLETVNTLPV